MVPKKGDVSTGVPTGGCVPTVGPTVGRLAKGCTGARAGARASGKRKARPASSQP